jgi:1,4-dihydroxy-2-naphthoyl-CoA hydrolase
MSLWKQPTDLARINAWSANTMMETLGIRITAIGDDWLQGTMPVDHRTHQPYGLLHGGASVVLAETLGSTAAMLTLDPEKELAVGLDINANHIRGVRSGTVTGTAKHAASSGAPRRCGKSASRTKKVRWYAFRASPWR